MDLEALERSINEIVRRHEALRTRFEVVEGEPAQDHPGAEHTARDGEKDELEQRLTQKRQLRQVDR